MSYISQMWTCTPGEFGRGGGRIRTYFGPITFSTEKTVKIIREGIDRDVTHAVIRIIHG